MIKNFAIIILVLSTQLILAQEDPKPEKINRFYVSLNAGFPSLTGVNLEYIIPKSNNRFSINADLGYLPINTNSFNTTLTYYSLGGNFHFSKTGKGAYFGIDYGKLPVKTTKVENKEVNQNATFTSINSKFGIKVGKAVFFKLELGYSIFLYDIEEANEYLSNTYGIKITPSIDFLQLLNGKIGFGVSF